MQKITTFLTFQDNGKEAVGFYTSVFKDSSIGTVMTMPGTETLLHAAFTLNGQEFMAMDGGPTFQFEEGTSLFVACEDQAEVDYYWEALSADGGEQRQCGWLRDKYGVSWQIIPNALGDLMMSSDQAVAGRVMQAMLQMGKIDIAGLQAAASTE